MKHRGVEGRGYNGAQLGNNRDIDCCESFTYVSKFIKVYNLNSKHCLKSDNSIYGVEIK